ncbi:Cache 3/Cache 2 fusion domain-containing protein [Oceanirhabdus sp. W0125-5]|uniref:Cache 3/Cache 2 fusion domain-containing protein n=1 Tax=Oceanirhabdus sp. W0125-5 TaxID=2999116 RepID=UPI0022F33286|nr:Cache 3/Cache 2 fusion domain-containing protein [Oceanirhabdus sp. W0125-5]WBW98635.1 Cache 3/Cache 2 fusion domain-containing protein [Oceanirhabdus sp. W0125-5]
MSIKSKLLWSYIFLILFTTSLLGSILGSKAEGELSTEIANKSETISNLILDIVSVRNNLLFDKVSTDLQYAFEILESHGNFSIDSNKKVTIKDSPLPILYAGDEALVNYNEYIKKVEDLTGAVCSIFLLDSDKLIRVSTNVTDNGISGFGTYIDSSEETYKKIINKESYYAITHFEDSWYISGYVPLFDNDNNVIGALGLGHEQLNDYLENVINEITIGTTGYVYIINSSGDVIFHPNLKGHNLSNYKFTKDIIERKSGSIGYEFKSTWKMASFKYFAPWDWYIVATANYDDIHSASKSIMYTAGFIGLIVLFIGIIIALFLSNTIIKPIMDLKSCMEQVTEGDLSVQCNIISTDEIAVLSNSFNNLVKENSRLLEETREYNKLKVEFFSNISHELKTPLNIIFTTTQLLEYKLTNAEELPLKKLTSYHTTIKQNCYRLLRLVNNLIDITKIDSGYFELNKINVNIVEIVEDITLSTVDYVTSKSRKIIFDTNTEEKIIAVDPEMMERIILNLISNAIKFTLPNDTITVTLTDLGDNVSLSIKDTGIGIAPEKQSIIFKRFRQVDRLLNRNHEGSGIGLSIVESLVKMHHGTITVESQLGIGSEFIITLPAKLATTSKDLRKVDASISNDDKVKKIHIEFSDIYS